MTSDNHLNNNKLKGRLAVCAFVASLIFGACGLFLPPLGVIHPTILIWLAQLLVFCAMLLGFSANENAVLKEIAEIMKEIKSN